MTEFNPHLKVSKIESNSERLPISDPSLSYNKPGVFVSIRPVAKEYEDKTFLGLYIGEIALGFAVRRNEHEDGTVDLVIERQMYNPAIFVFDLNKVIFGIESWWGVIRSEDDLRQISNQDIDNVWYVKALKQLQEKPGRFEK